MRRLSLLLLATFVACSTLVAQQKLAQTGMKFLNVGVDPRASALGGAISAVEGYATSMFYNPAGMANQATDVDGFIGTTLWIADITYGSGAVALRPADGDLGVFGLSFVTVNYGEIFETIPANNEQGYTDVGKFTPTSYALGLGYARALSEKFSVGGNIKYVQQHLGNPFNKNVNGVGTRSEFSHNVWAFDLGVLYKTGFKSLNFGMTVRNFATELKYVTENYQLPLTFRIGVSMNVFDLLEIDKNEQSFMLSVDAEHPRDFPEQIRIGGEYTFLNLFSLRTGYVSGTNEEGLTYGVGALKMYDEQSKGSVGVDYAYTPFGVFGKVHRFSFRFSF